MAEEEEDKGLVEFLKKSAEKATGFFGRFSSGQLYPGQPLIGPKGPVRPGSAPGLTDPVARSIVERQRRAKLPDPIRKRIEAGEDAQAAPDPVPLPGPVQEASDSERTGLAASEPVLFDSGLVTVQGKSTPAGRALFKNAQAKGQDPNQMIDFYARGLVDENLRVTERGRIFEEIDRTNSLDSILAINDRTEGFRLYLEAAESGAVTEWQDRTGAGADTWQEFLDQAAENFLPDAAEVLKLVKGFVPGGATFYDRLVRDNPLGYFGGVAGAALKLGKGKLSKEEEAELALMRDEYLREGVFRTAASYSDGFVAALTHGPGTKEFFSDRDRAAAKYHFWKDQYDVDNMEAGEAVGEVVGFAESVKETVADDVSFFEGKATAQDELVEVETAKARAGRSVQDAVAYLDQLDVVDPQNQPRAEQVRDLMLPFSSIASPDVVLSVGAGAAISGAFKMGGKVSRLRKDLTDKKADRRRVDAQLQAAKGAQKRATPSAQAQLAPARLRGPSTADVAKLQTRRTKLDSEIAKLEKRIGRIDGTVPGRVAGFIGSVGRSARSMPLRAAGATASVTGSILQRLGNIVGPVAGAVVAGSAMGGNPLGYGVGMLAGRALGLGARGKTLSRVGEKMSRVGEEFSRRRMAYPMFRKFAQEAKTNKLKQYHLGREAAYGLTVGLTAKFAKLWRDAFLGELPFSYVASGGFSQVGGNFLSQAAAESLLIEAPIIGAGKMVGRAAGMQLSGDVKEHNRLAYNAALNFRDQFLTDPDQRAAFDSLPPIVKRMYGNAYTNNPDLKIQFITDLEEGSGLYDPDSNTITINPNDPRGVETILAHEFRHHMDTQGFRQAIIEAAVGPRGFLRQTPANETVQGSGELIPEFKEWAESYNQIRLESGRKPYDLNDPEELGDVVMEWSAYSSMDSVAAGLRNNVLIEWSRRHPWLRSFYDSLLGRFFRQDSLMNAGLLFDQNGNLATQPGLPGMKALKEHPALSARLERMMKDRAGIGLSAAELSDLDDPNSKRKKPSPTAIRQGDTEALKEVQRDMHMDLKTDQQGNVVEVKGVAEIKPEPPPRELLPVLPDKDFDAPRVNEGRGTDNATDLTGSLTAPVLNKDGTRKDIIPGKPTELVRRDDNVEALKAHFREGYGYNDLQLGMIDDLIDIMSDPDRRGEAVLGYYFPVWKKERKKARKGDWKQYVPKKGIDAKWYRFVPYGLVQTDVGNVIVKAINMDQVLRNAQTIAKSKKGLKAYQGDVSSLMDDFYEMVRNHGRNIQNATRFTPDKLALLNAVFGDVGRGHKEANLLLQNDAQISQARSAVRSFRIERFSQMNSGIKAGFPFSLEKTKALEMPARDPQVQQEGTVFARSIEQIKEAIPERFIGTKVPGAPVVAPDGKPFLESDLSTPVGPLGVTQQVIDNSWSASIEESGPAAQEAIDRLAQEGNTMEPPLQKHFDAASKLPLRDRFWYETSAEAMRISFPEQAKVRDSGKVMDVIAATSPLADPNYNAELTVSILSEDYSGTPSVTPAVVQTGVQDALMGRFGTGEQRKIGSFGQTFRFLSGLTEDAPLSTNDRQVASSFGVPDNVFGQYPVLYEVVSRFYNKIRDHINSQPNTQAMGPFQSWQLQALSWVETRARQRLQRRTQIADEDAYQGDAYASAFNKVAGKLRDAGVTVQTDPGTGLPLFDDKILSDPRTTSTLVPTATEFAAAQIQTMEVVTKLTQTGADFLNALDESKALGIDINVRAADKVITRHSKRLANRRKEGNKKWSLLTKLASVFGKDTAEVTRVEYGYGTFEGDFQPNIRIPLIEVPPVYREAYLAVLGKHYHQAAQASSYFKSVEPGEAQTYSVWFQGADDLSVLGTMAAELSAVGHESNVSIRPNGVLVDIHPSFADDGTQVAINKDILKLIAKKTGETTGSKPQIMSRAYESNYIEKGDYGDTIGKAKKQLVRDAARKVQEIAGSSLRDSENFVRGNYGGLLSGNRAVNRRAEKVRDSYRVRLDRLKSVEKGLRQASRDLAADMDKATAEMRKRIDRARKQTGQE